MPLRKDDALVGADDSTLIERCVDFSLGSQPVCHRITTFETTMFGMEIGGIGNPMVMLGCREIDCRFFMQFFCYVHGMRHDVPPLKIS
jgi:hypothetical protein